MMETLVIVGGLIVVLMIAYLRGRANGYNDGYFNGHIEGSAKSATIDKRPTTHSTEQMIRVARAAYHRGYRKGQEDMRHDESSSGS